MATITETSKKYRHHEMDGLDTPEYKKKQPSWLLHCELCIIHCSSFYLVTWCLTLQKKNTKSLCFMAKLYNHNNLLHSCKKQRSYPFSCQLMWGAAFASHAQVLFWYGPSNLTLNSHSSAATKLQQSRREHVSVGVNSLNTQQIWSACLY